VLLRSYLQLPEIKVDFSNHGGNVVPVILPPIISAGQGCDAGIYLRKYIDRTDISISISNGPKIKRRTHADGTVH
jgi:hypothetical protein